jgi:hypothetical protein
MLQSATEVCLDSQEMLGLSPGKMLWSRPRSEEGILLSHEDRHSLAEVCSAQASSLDGEYIPTEGTEDATHPKCRWMK